jgi:hypothetical protein
LKAQGNFVVDETWQEGKITNVTITSNAGQPLRIRYAGLKNECYVIRLNGEGVAPIADEDVYTIPGVKKDDVVTITYEDGTGIKKPSSSNEDSASYTLSGKRIAHEQKGCVVVKKGKKYIRKS